MYLICSPSIFNLNLLQKLCFKRSVQMIFDIGKIEKIAKDLEPYRYVKRKKISGWQSLEDVDDSKKTVPNDTAEWQNIQIGHIWQGENKYFWTKTTLKIPNDFEEEVLLFDLGLLGNLKHTGIEAMLFIDGYPYQGVDAHHQEIFLDPKYKGKEVQIALRLWTGLPGRKGNSQDPMLHIFKMADIASVDKKVDELYYLVKNGVETLSLLANDDPQRINLLNSLDLALRKLDWSDPGSENFYQSCYQAKKELELSLRSLKENKPKYTVNGIGHTHIDLAWLWQIKHTKQKAARSFSTVLRLMDKYPEYTFFASTPQLYQYVKDDYPEIYAQIKQRVAQGRWEVDGAMWVEADCNISSGESLVRQLLYGTSFFEKEFGKQSHTLWLPDVFGYSWALPQILKKSGIDTFMTTKLSWNEFNRMPHDTFFWKGLDGSEILTHFITTPDPNDSKGPFYYTYNGTITPETVKGIYNSYQDKNVNSSLLLAYGYGDGGGGTTRDMIENIHAINQLPGLPKITTNRTQEYFSDLHENIKNAAQDGRYVHTWDGELYFEYHRATYTGHADNKKNNRKIEILLKELEFAETNAMLNDEKWHYPSGQIEQAWKLLLKNQFHDIIPGSAIHEVYEDSKEDYMKIYSIISELFKQMQNKFVTVNDSYSLINSTGWQRQTVVEIPENRSGKFVDQQGNDLPSQKIGNKTLVVSPAIPGSGNRKISFVPGLAKKTSTNKVAKVSENSLENIYYRLKWNTQGQLTQIFDKQNSRNVLADGARGNVLEIFEDRPRDYDAWNLDISYKEKRQEIPAQNIEVIEKGALCTIVRFTYTFNKSQAQQDMVVYNDQKRIDFKTTIDWRERQRILKSSFYTDIRATEATYQIQYGNVRRPTNWNNSWNMAKFETLGHQWADLSEHDYGVALMNDSKYGYDIFENKISISLLTGSVSPDKTADIGRHEFTYSLLPHKGDFVTGDVEKEAWNLNDPINVVCGSLDVPAQLFKWVNGDTIFVDSIKKAEDSSAIVVRMHEYAGGSAKVQLQPNFAIRDVVETGLLEKESESNIIVGQDGQIDLKFSPYEIKTVMFKR